MSAPLRILLLAGPLETDPELLCGLDLIRAFRARGHQITLMAGDGPLSPRFKMGNGNLAVVDISGNVLRDLTRIRSIHREVAHRKPDLIHVLDPRLGRVGAVVSRISRRPFVLSVPDTRERSSVVGSPRLRAVIAPSRAVRNELIEKRAIPAERIRVAPLGIDPRRFPGPAAAEPDRLPVLCTVVPRSPGEGLGDLLKAIRILIDRGVELHLLVAGSGSWETGTHRLIRRLDLCRHVTLTPLSRHCESFLSTMHIFVGPNRRDGMAVSILNAMAAGRPVVATGVGSTFDLVREGQTGYLVPRAAPEALARKIHRILSDRDLARMMGENGRARVESEFTVRRRADALVNIYREALA